MRSKTYTPLPNIGKAIEEIDLGDERAAGPDAIAFTHFKFVPEIALKDIHIPILTPLGDEDVPGSPAEPVFDSAAQRDIQGNIIPGFNKDHQHFLFLTIGKPKPAKAFLREILPGISTMEEVMAFRRLYRSKRLLLGRHRTYLCSTWINIGFSRRAIELLANKADADAFGDGSFQLGLAQRSSYLGDPTTSSHRGSPGKWKVGGPKNEADIVIILASDHADVLDDLVELTKQRARDGGLKVIFEQRGDTLSGTCADTSTLDSRMVSLSQAYAANSLPRPVTTSPRATFPPPIPGASTWPSLGSNWYGRVNFSWANNGKAPRTRSMPSVLPPTFQSGPGAAPIWWCAGCSRTSRRSTSSWRSERREPE